MCVLRGVGKMKNSQNSSLRLEAAVTAQMASIPSLPELSSEYLARLVAADVEKRKKLVQQYGITAYLVF